MFFFLRIPNVVTTIKSTVDETIEHLLVSCISRTGLVWRSESRIGMQTPDSIPDTWARTLCKQQTISFHSQPNNSFIINNMEDFKSIAEM